MKTLSWVAAAASLLSCSSSSEREHGSVMDEIENAVRLPAGSASLSRYARFYAPTAGGKVLAVYVTPRKPRAAGESCEELKSDLTFRPVKCEDLPQAAWETAKAGERRWVSEKDLPSFNDGGCSVIEVVFDSAHHSLVSADCNGQA